MSFELKIFLTVAFVFVGALISARFLLKDIRRDFEAADRAMEDADQELQHLERPRG